MLASTGAGVMQLWKINDECEFLCGCPLHVVSLFAVAIMAVLTPTNEVPYTVTSVLFCDKGATVLVFELETRLVYDIVPSVLRIY